MARRVVAYDRLNDATQGDDSDEDEDEIFDERERRKRIWVSRLNWLWRKGHAAFWVGLSSFLIYYTNFFKVVWECQIAQSVAFFAGIGCLLVNISALFYLGVVAPLRGIEAERLRHHYPSLIPTMAGIGFLCFFFLNIALWPIWGWLTFLLLISMFLGFLNSSEFLPGGTVGSILMFVVMMGAVLSIHFIPHEGSAHDQELCYPKLRLEIAESQN